MYAENPDTPLANLDDLIRRLTAHMGRTPTEQEVTDFIFGDTTTRLSILNKE